LGLRGFGDLQRVWRFTRTPYAAFSGKLLGGSVEVFLEIPSDLLDLRILR
jgi:hypothetical protein